jgi:hypothetical protein
MAGHRQAVMSLPGSRSQNRKFSRVTVTEGEYFLMGDAWDNGED